VPYIEYSFGGDVDVAAFDALTMALQEWGLASMLVHGTVARLELAHDIVGCRTDDCLSHLIGVKSSQVKVSDNKMGRSYYSGSPASDVQLIAYDKSEQMKSLGETPEFDRALRIEVILRRLGRPLTQVYQWLQENDPLKGVLVVPTMAAHALSTSVKSWPSFLHDCHEIGVADALTNYPSSKKTFLANLSKLSGIIPKPSISSYKGAISKLLPPALVAPVMVGADLCN
jgi:hypothetical protein